MENFLLHNLLCRIILKSQEFVIENKIVFCFSMKNMTKNVFKIIIKARGGRESLSKSNWEKNIGNEFPFIIDSAESNDLELIEITDEYIQFVVVNDQSIDHTISVVVKTIRKDAAIDFELFTFK